MRDEYRFETMRANRRNMLLNKRDRCVVIALSVVLIKIGACRDLASIRLKAFERARPQSELNCGANICNTWGKMVSDFRGSVTLNVKDVEMSYVVVLHFAKGFLKERLKNASVVVVL